MAKENYAGVAQCPGCGAQEATKVGFVWWGGVLAAKLIFLATAITIIRLVGVF